MTKLTHGQRAQARTTLTQIREMAETLADTIDPDRRFTHSEETAREILKACGVIGERAGRGLAYLDHDGRN